MTISGSDRTARLVLDTSGYTHLRAGHDDVHSLVASAAVVHVPTIVLGELDGGFRVGRRERENQIALNEFLAEPFVTTIPVTGAVARRYGAVFAELRRSGTPVPVNDMWIAACAQEVAAPLLTFDRDFERIHGLETILLDADG